MPRVSRLPSKNAALTGLIVLFVTVGLATLFIQLASASCDQEYRSDETVSIKGERVHVQIARPSEATKGLGGKSCIGKNQAMLFELPPGADGKVWMKDMNFPIDIIWLNDKKEVIQLATGVSPDTYPQEFSAGQPAAYILEMPASRANQLGIQKGTTINL